MLLVLYRLEGNLQEDLKKLLTIIIPTLNEEEAIGHVIDEILEHGFKPNQILVVDGYSTDKTVEIARSKGVQVIYQKGRGKADAIRTAMEYVNTPYMLVMDGDYTYPAKHIIELLEKIHYEGHDEVIGSRVKGRENIPPINRFGNRILTLFFNILFGTRLTDVLSGMYILRTESVRTALFESKGFSIESEIAAHVVSSGGSVVEHPIEYRRRRGKKKLRVTDGIKIAIDIVKLAWKYNPVFFIALIGSLLLLPGLMLTSYVIYNYLFHGIKYYIKGIIAAVATCVGLVSILLAILALYLKRMEWRILRQIREIEKKCGS